MATFSKDKTMTSRFDAVGFARALINIDSTTGREAEAGLAEPQLQELGYSVANSRSPTAASMSWRVARSAAVVFSTHYDCVPPFFPSRVEKRPALRAGRLRREGDSGGTGRRGRAAARRGERRVGLLFVVGEERGSDGAAIANASPAVRGF